jgi:protein SCO1/2
VFFLQQPNKPIPLVKGYLLKNPVNLPFFTLEDHKKQGFDNNSLVGYWHVIAYGYLTCPDICPMTLVTLSHLAQQLQDEELAPEIKFIFYSIDPLRDSSEKLASYLAYFDSAFIGLRAFDNKNKTIFEKSLSIKVNISMPITHPTNYAVSHDVALFIINPKGQLQAVFKPNNTTFNSGPFDAKVIYVDLLKVLAYYQAS